MLSFYSFLFFFLNSAFYPAFNSILGYSVKVFKLMVELVKIQYLFSKLENIKKNPYDDVRYAGLFYNSSPTQFKI